MKLRYSIIAGFFATFFLAFDYRAANPMRKPGKKNCNVDACMCSECRCKNCSGNCSIKYVKEDFRIAMRQLWNDHGTWTREYVVATLAQLPTADLAAQRLLKNQDDIGKGIVPFYGVDAGRKLAQLLKEHILIAVDVLKAAQKGDQKTLNSTDKKWHANAVEISQFLSNANPNIKFDMMRAMLFEHLKLLTNIITSRLKQQWSEDIALYDSYRNQLSEMSDALAYGIIHAFPEKFK